MTLLILLIIVVIAFIGWLSYKLSEDEYLGEPTRWRHRD